MNFEYLLYLKNIFYNMQVCINVNYIKTNKRKYTNICIVLIDECFEKRREYQSKII